MDRLKWPIVVFHNGRSVLLHPKTPVKDLWTGDKETYWMDAKMGDRWERVETAHPPMLEDAEETRNSEYA